jgi:hypothetical protein
MAIKTRIGIIRLEKKITVEINENSPTRISSVIKIVVDSKEGFLKGQLCSATPIRYGEIQIIDLK